MLLISWNVNGLARRYDEVKELIAAYAPDFLCLQKVRSKEDRGRFTVDGYRQLFAPVDFGDWSGVSTYVRNDSGMTLKRIASPELSLNGHLQAYRCNSFVLLNTYVPFGNQKLDGAVEYRRKWDEMYRSFVKDYSGTLPVIICGDLNIVHTGFDCCADTNPQERISQNGSATISTVFCPIATLPTLTAHFIRRKRSLHITAHGAICKQATVSTTFSSVTHFCPGLQVPKFSQTSAQDNPYPSHSN